MMKSFIERENEIFDVLNSFNKSSLRYVLVGGYAVSAYMHRFSVDGDVCIDEQDLNSFKELLNTKKFVSTARKEIEDLYKGKSECYTKKTKLPVTVDLMINSVASRQTGYSISFEQLYKNSNIKKITGIEKTVEARIPIKELLIVLKIHSARLTDARDIVALCQNTDFDFVKKFMGNSKKVQLNLKKLQSILTSENFKDSFKGVFSIEKLTPGSIENGVELIEELLKL